MVKTKAAPTIGGMGTWDEITTIRECKNLVRWNAPLAIQFMEHASGRVCNMSSLIIREYNKSVQSINEYLDILERQRYYNNAKREARPHTNNTKQERCDQTHAMFTRRYSLSSADLMAINAVRC